MTPESIFKTAGDPILAHHQWEGLHPLLDIHKNSPELPILLHVLGNSRFLANWMINHPELTQALLIPGALHQVKNVSQKQAELASQIKDTSVPEAQKILRQYKYQDFVRITARLLAGLAPFEETGQELTSLAQALLTSSCRIAKVENFSVVGLGKLGGDDLNFSSDVDILFLFSATEAKAGFEKACDAAKLITRLLDERTEEGIGFRVDLNLRPEGKSGPLVNSLESFSSYYEIRGDSWERVALLKARHVGGEPSLTESALAELEPFVYRKSIDPGIILEIKRMKEKIDQELLKISKTKRHDYNVKLNSGGIREIEFFTSAFQLIYGGKIPILRERNTLKALSLLESHGLVPANDAISLREAYIFLRRTENFLQMDEEQQTHTLPTDSKDLAKIARQMKCRDIEDFLTALKEHTDFVQLCFERLAP